MFSKMFICFYCAEGRSNSKSTAYEHFRTNHKDCKNVLGIYRFVDDNDPKFKPIICALDKEKLLLRELNSLKSAYKEQLEKEVKLQFEKEMHLKHISAQEVELKIERGKERARRVIAPFPKIG